MNPNDSQERLSRREVIKWFVAAAAVMSANNSLPLNGAAAFGAEATKAAGGAGARPYGTDPDLMKIYNRGDVWPLTLTEPQRRTVTALCDVILPADHLGPAASAVGVPAFIDEWVSAPYPLQQADRPIILDGLASLETESKKRFTQEFSALTPAQQQAICDDICNTETARPEFKPAAAFFAQFRSIAAGGYFSTPEGWKAIGYVGNIPTATFDGPPKEVLEKLGVEQTVE
jgi:Gluconate 2-dehydrogenase subunit 3